MLQPKLELGQPNDKFEREADRIVNLIVDMKEPVTHVSQSNVRGATNTVKIILINPVLINRKLILRNLLI